MSAPAPPRVVVTAAAAALLRHLTDVHGPLMVHQSGGCCDGSAPMCFPLGEFAVGDHDVLLGVLDLSLGVGEVPVGSAEDEDEDAVPVWISGPQFDAWKHTQLVLDVVPGRGAGFSLEAPEGVRLLSRSRVFDDAEQAALAARPPVVGAEWARGRRPDPEALPVIVASAVREESE